LILLDQAESALYELDLELSLTHQDHSSEIHLIVADVSNFLRMKEVFAKYEPDVVFHAAAYKHVPLMEEHPFEAVRVNVYGTWNVVSLSELHCVDKMVLISSDKAVNPANVMGATKRLAETIVRYRSDKVGRTKFLVLRFGNVLDSRGSVFHTLLKQIEAGGPVTVTDSAMERYFLTLDEATSLIIMASSMGERGDVFVFDMGKSVKIIDLAKKLIQLKGLQERKDIEIHLVGLRPGEKINEELLATGEEIKKTMHEKIIRIVPSSIFPEHFDRRIEKLLSELEKAGNKEAIVRHIKDLVPEFISNNSPYSQLDPTEAVNT
jgi:FlaA1/EpsC-like NDP-sugar epimerase